MNNTLAKPRLSVTARYEQFVDQNQTAYSGFGIDRVKRHPVSRIVYAKNTDVYDDQIVAELLSIGQVSLTQQEIVRSLSPSALYLECPLKQLAPLRAPYPDRSDDRWMESLGIWQLRGWVAKGYGDYAAHIAYLERSVIERFDEDLIQELNLLAEYDGAGTLSGWDWVT